MPDDFPSFCKKYLLDGEVFPIERMLDSQLDYITLKGKICVDFIGRFENLQEDFLIIKKKLGLNLSLPDVRKRKHKPYWMFYDEESKKIVFNKYKEEINFLNYSFR